MREFLIRTFIKDADCIKAPAVRTRYGNLASLTGMLVNIAVCLGELIVGFIVGSLAMISDGLHNVADAGGSAISLLSFRLSARKPDQEHPYGHGRMEYLFSVGFSVLLFVIA
ncbi:MAG: cation diffusion facilitator family transporter, partial [Veillonella sp.]|nr:cation diffusion facilitator family transporter [Veillonella sp.]